MNIKYYKKRLRWFLTVDIREWANQYLGPIRKKHLKGDDFTIISNNCWGGMYIADIQ